LENTGKIFENKLQWQKSGNVKQKFENHRFGKHTALTKGMKPAD